MCIDNAGIDTYTCHIHRCKNVELKNPVENVKSDMLYVCKRCPEILDYLYYVQLTCLMPNMSK